MKTLVHALVATIALSAAPAALADGAPAATPLHPALLSAPIYAVYADASRLVAADRREAAVAHPLHPALVAPPIFAAHADASRLVAGPAAPVEVSQAPN
ncbi:hypothetical protein [Azospirillum sp. ST 5-10]|uniref:hypothetical protein n=1 Tax=unclassified Azospirillum TaxID=2630922 RepID=UPI003F4A40C9